MGRMTDTSAPTLFTRVTDMVAEFIDWIGGRDPLTIPRAFYRKAQRHLCVIEDMLRGALYILALDLTVAPMVPKPAASARVTPETTAPLPRKATLRIGLFNIRPVADRVPPTPPTGPRDVSTRARVFKPDLTTDAFLRRIARIEAAMADPDTHAIRLARHRSARPSHRAASSACNPTGHRAKCLENRNCTAAMRGCWRWWRCVT